MARIIRRVAKSKATLESSHPVLPESDVGMRVSEKLSKLRSIEEQNPNSLITPEQASLLVNVTEGT